MNVTTSLGTGFSADFLAYDETIGRVAKARHHVYALTGIEPTDILLLEPHSAANVNHGDDLYR